MTEKAIIEYIRNLYPEGCVISLLITKTEVKLLSSEIAKVEE